MIIYTCFVNTLGRCIFYPVIKTWYGCRRFTRNDIDGKRAWAASVLPKNYQPGTKEWVGFDYFEDCCEFIVRTKAAIEREKLFKKLSSDKIVKYLLSKRFE